MVILFILVLILMPVVGLTLGHYFNGDLTLPQFWLNHKEVKMENTISSRHRKGNMGEDTVGKYLALLDSNEYKIINNALFRLKNDVMVQIDHIVVARTGIFVIETKNYGGIVEQFGNDRWRQIWYRSKFDFYSPVKQNESHIKSLMYVLFTKKRELFKSFIVFPDSTIIHRQQGTPAITAKVLCRCIEEYDTHILTYAQRDEIYNKLCARNICDKNTIKKHRKRVSTIYN